jgi:hypothetical protein
MQGLDRELTDKEMAWIREFFLRSSLMLRRQRGKSTERGGNLKAYHELQVLGFS